MGRCARVFSRRSACFGKRTCKPNSVACGHSSRRRVTADAHQRPTRRFRQWLEPPFACRAGTQRRLALAAAASLPIWSCSVWGLPCLRRYRRSGALLPHLFTLTPEQVPGRYVFCGTGRLRALTPASRTLSGTLPCGVRTFLSRSACARRQRPPGPPAVLSLQGSGVRGQGSGIRDQESGPGVGFLRMALWITFQRALFSLIRRLSALRSR